MTKGNQKTKNTGQINTDFDALINLLDAMAVRSEKLMPLFSASLKLSIKILREYKKAAVSMGVKNG